MKIYLIFLRHRAMLCKPSAHKRKMKWSIHVFTLHFGNENPLPHYEIRRKWNEAKIFLKELFAHSYRVSSESINMILTHTHNNMYISFTKQFQCSARIHPEVCRIWFVNPWNSFRNIDSHAFNSMVYIRHSNRQVKAIRWY